MGGWDTHSDNFKGTPRQAAVLDQVMSALLADLHAKGLLDQTLGVLGAEFGRTTRINDNDGRNHSAKLMACLLAGAGMKVWRTYTRRLRQSPGQLRGNTTPGGSP